MGRCQRPFPVARPAQCTDRPGLALRQGERRWLLAQATMQWPLRKCRHEEMLSMLPLPPHPRHPLMHAQVGGCSPTGLLFLQPSPRRGKWPPWAGGDASSPHCGEAEPPEQCQHCLLLWETASCRGRNLASLQTSTRATGISLQRLFFSGDLFPGLER